MQFFSLRIPVWSTISLSAVLSIAPWGFSQEGASIKKSYTYKTVGECKINADVYRHGQEKNRPVVVWIHGGALIMGNRGQIDRELLRKLLEAGYVVVSIDYRLAPETKLPAILEDLEDACKWVRVKGPELFGIDPDKMAVMGGSAGGYPTVVSGVPGGPRPPAPVSM